MVVAKPKKTRSGKKRKSAGNDDNGLLFLKNKL